MGGQERVYDGYRRRERGDDRIPIFHRLGVYKADMLAREHLNRRAGGENRDMHGIATTSIIRK